MIPTKHQFYTAKHFAYVPLALWLSAHEKRTDPISFKWIWLGLVTIGRVALCKCSSQIRLPFLYTGCGFIINESMYKIRLKNEEEVYIKSYSLKSKFEQSIGPVVEEGKNKKIKLKILNSTKNWSVEYYTIDKKSLWKENVMGTNDHFTVPQNTTMLPMYQEKCSSLDALNVTCLIIRTIR